jgi:hypothetical protein
VSFSILFFNHISPFQIGIIITIIKCFFFGSNLLQVE